MPFIERTGDMFADQSLDALAHGVNCEGAMGGIAGMFANKYPDMATYYRRICAGNGLNTGDILPWRAEGTPMIYNLATQQHGGPDAKYEHIDTTMGKMLSHAEKNGIQNIGVPQIGCGIGGLEWPKVKSILKKHAENSPVNVVAYTYGEPTPKTASAWYNN
jgi:O-acetyl-ADP-ribose deacetylase (regulator of RNase III)